MKKIISLILLVVVVLALSGCQEETNWEDMSDLQQSIYCAKDENKALTVCVMYYYELEQQTSYTKEEVNQMLDQQANEIMEMIYDSYVEYDEFDKILYSNCKIVDGLKKCDIVLDLNKDYVTIQEYQELLDRIEELESEE